MKISTTLSFTKLNNQFEQYKYNFTQKQQQLNFSKNSLIYTIQRLQQDNNNGIKSNNSLT